MIELSITIERESAFKADQSSSQGTSSLTRTNPVLKVATETALVSVTETLKMARAAAQSSVLILLEFIWFSQPPHRCCFALFSIRKIRQFLTQHVTQLLVQEWWSPTLTSAMHQTKADPCESATSQAQVTYAELHVISWNCFLCLNSLVRAHATSAAFCTWALSGKAICAGTTILTIL